MARPRSKKRSWRQGQKARTKRYFKKQSRKDERQQDKALARQGEEGAA